MAKVIIVEDDPMVSRIHQQYIEQFSELTLAGNFRSGRDALEFLRFHPVDLIILDVYMPIMTGLDLLRALRHEGQRCDVIMVTAANDVENIDAALSLGILDYLVKPFEYQRFSAAIEKYLKKANLISSRRTLTQDSIDRLVSTHSTAGSDLSEAKKGIQSRTLEHVREHLMASDQVAHTCDSISNAIGLSKVTVRRYLNYLIECGELDSSIDYETGGRPSVLYYFKHR